MSRSKADRLLSAANSADIILYIQEHPGCKKSDVYRNITRNAHTPEMFMGFVEAGLLQMEEIGIRSFLTLTPKGEHVAGLLRELDETLGRD